MFEQVKEAFRKQLKLGDKEITAESKIKDDLGADSLDILQLLMTIEETYGGRHCELSRKREKIIKNNIETF